MKSRDFKSKAELIKNVAVLIVEDLSDSIKRNDVAHLAVSGGSTPLALFQYLKEHCLNSLNWNKVHFWWVDERYVAHDDQENNFQNAMEAGLEEIQAVFHRVNVEGLSISKAVQQYENEIQQILGAQNFDLIILGAGTDGHTASLFTPNMNLVDDSRLVVSTINPNTKQQRISLNFKQLVGSECTLLLLSGESKRSILNQVETKKETPINWVLQNANQSLIYHDLR